MKELKIVETPNIPLRECAKTCNGQNCYCQKLMVNAEKYADLKFKGNCSVFECEFEVENYKIVEINVGYLINLEAHDYPIDSGDAFGGDEMIAADLNEDFEEHYKLEDGRYKALLYVNYEYDEYGIYYDGGGDYDAYCTLEKIEKNEY